MTISAISTSSAAINSLALVSAVKPVRRDHPREGASSGTPTPTTTPDGNSAQGGGKLYTALLSALEQFVTSHPAAGATASGATGTITGATASGATGTITGATASGATATGTGAVKGGTVTSSGTTTTAAAASTLPQDLQAFLHDLAGALRHAGGAGRHHSDADTQPQAAAAAASASVPVPATPAPGLSNPGGVAQYRQHDLISALQALISDVSNSHLLASASASATAGGSSSLPGNTVSALNQAFAKLVGDLGGSTAAASSGSASAGTSASTGAGGGSTVTSATPAQADTVALQSFLTGFLQDLQHGSSSATSTLGNTVDTTA